MSVDTFGPAVLWFTGLSGAGKTTIAMAVTNELQSRGVRAELLDGDLLRAQAPTGFSREERNAHVVRAGVMASRLESEGIVVACALISPFEESRNRVRSLCKRFFEIYVATPLAECERRDVKGLYAKARRGELQSLTGVNDPYELPRRPELTLDTTRISLQGCVELALRAIAIHSPEAARPAETSFAALRLIEVSRRAPGFE